MVLNEMNTLRKENKGLKLEIGELRGHAVTSAPSASDDIMIVDDYSVADEHYYGMNGAINHTVSSAGKTEPHTVSGIIVLGVVVVRSAHLAYVRMLRSRISRVS